MVKPKDDQQGVSLNKYISASGFCSRREADELIDMARVTINDELAQKTDRVQVGDVVEIDGEPIKKKVVPIYIAFNKPAGVTSTTDATDRSNIIYYINHPKRIFPIGRLDKDSEGLIFLTNDGDVVNKILRAGNNHDKEYIVVTDKPVTHEFVQAMAGGVRLQETTTKKCTVKQEGNKSFRITLTQGLNRQIRRMCAALDYKVVKLTRVRIMNISLNLPPGKWRYFTPDEIQRMNSMLEHSDKTEEASVAAKTEAGSPRQYIPKRKKK